MSFRIFKTMETPSADVRAPSKLTPRIQAYCVSALRARVTMCLGMAMLFDEGTASVGGSFAADVEFAMLGNSKGL